MIELLIHKLSALKSREEKFNVTREYLQILILKILSEAQAFQGIAFLGGTALRILYQLRRYSEDLDFSVIAKGRYDFEQVIAAVARELELQNLPVVLKMKAGVVDSCMITFTSVLQEVGIAIARDQRLAVKLEVDTNPPAGAVVTDTLVNADFIFPVRHYDIPSLMAGKLHAVMYRKFIKGRDYYDLLWYLSRKTDPNLDLLSNAIYQTEGEQLALGEGKWKLILQEKLERVDFRKVRRDLEPFIFDQREVELITAEQFKALLASSD